jgi:hypothetical protein
MRSIYVSCIAFIATAHAISSGTGTITCIGDSWAQFSCDTLAAVVKSHNKTNTVVNKGVGGSTAAYWAKNTALVRSGCPEVRALLPYTHAIQMNMQLIDAILSGGYPSFIWLSIGGDDILGGWQSQACSGNGTSPSSLACYREINKNINTMLTAIYKDFPLVQVN